MTVLRVVSGGNGAWRIGGCLVSKGLSLTLLRSSPPSGGRADVPDTHRALPAPRHGSFQGRARQLFRLAVVVPHRLDVVAVGVVHKRSVVPGPVIAVAGLAVVLASRRQGRF